MDIVINSVFVLRANQIWSFNYVHVYTDPKADCFLLLNYAGHFLLLFFFKLTHEKDDF